MKIRKIEERDNVGGMIWLKELEYTTCIVFEPFYYVLYDKEGNETEILEDAKKVSFYSGYQVLKDVKIGKVTYKAWEELFVSYRLTKKNKQAIMDMPTHQLEVEDFVEIVPEYEDLTKLLEKYADENKAYEKQIQEERRISAETIIKLELEIETLKLKGKFQINNLKEKLNEKDTILREKESELEETKSSLSLLGMIDKFLNKITKWFVQ